MKSELLWLIQPNYDLRKELEKYSADVASLFSGPLIWIRTEGGLIRQQPDQRKIEWPLKIAFLARLLHYYGDSLDKEVQTALTLLLGQRPFRVGMFDRWWTLEMVEDCEHFDEAVKTVESEVFRLFASTGIQEVDTWLQETNHL